MPSIGQEETFVGELRGLQKKYNPAPASAAFVGHLIDDTGALGLLWYRAPSYLVNTLSPDNACCSRQSGSGAWAD